jgi:hypothetical protein
MHGFLEIPPTGGPSDEASIARRGGVMTKQTTAAPPQLADVDRNIAGVHRAMTKFAALIASDDPAVRSRVVNALAEMGEFAGGPLAAAIGRTPDVKHMVVMLGMLRMIGSFADPKVYELLRRLSRKAPHPLIEKVAEEILFHLAGRHAERELVERTRAQSVGSTAGGRAGHAPA